MISFVLAMALGAAPAEGTPDTPNVCSIVRTAADYLRRPNDTWAVASLLPDTVRDDSVFEPFDGLARDTTDAHQGRLVRIGSSAGRGADGVAAPGSVVAVFVWGLGFDCSLYAGAFWQNAQETQHFTMALRPESAWVAGVPTFDVGPFGLGYYPPAGGGNQETLSVDRYAEMVRMVPQEEDWNEDCRPGTRRLNRWMWDHGRPFKRMIESLVGLCENSIAQHARSHERYGHDAVPSNVAMWARRSGCSIPRAWREGPMNVVSGRFMPGSSEQWAVICAYDDRWRLVVLDRTGETELAELAQMTGSPEYWQLTAVSPAYFDWAPLGESENDPHREPNPENDSVVLSSIGSVAFYWKSVRWTGIQHDCCAWRY